MRINEARFMYSIFCPSCLKEAAISSIRTFVSTFIAALAISFPALSDFAADNEIGLSPAVVFTFAAGISGLAAIVAFALKQLELNRRRGSRDQDDED